MVKVLSSRFQQCFSPFTMLLVEGSSETVIFRYLFNNVFRSPNVQKYISYEGRLFFLKRVKSESSLSLKKRILVIGSQCVNKISQDFAFAWERLFPTDVFSQWSINMVTVLSFIFQQCFGMFTMLLVEGSSEAGLFRHLSNHVFQNPEDQKYMSSEGHLFLRHVEMWI